ncbi:MAG: DNA gyrase C-terminal beta-propeller domain-containing protein, partial [Candidatus Cloacimonetes bacterium]|nr:DNA gyrase C-terminal beta-propeller domain-containing protein [Candidatus Cloacimonadota bacterium]
EDDFIQYVFVASTHSYILLFTDYGRCYWLKVYEVPEVGRTARGKAIVNLVQFQEGEKIRAFVTLKQFLESQSVIMATKKGVVKKTSLPLFSRPRSGGILAIKLMEGDELIDARITNGNDDILLATANGYCNRFNENDVRETGRFTQGVRGISLRDNDVTISMSVIRQEDTLENGTPIPRTILAISENGYGKRTTIASYTKTKRGSKGVITLKTTIRNGHLASLMIVEDADDLMIITQGGMIIRQRVSEISQVSRNTQGVKLINLVEKDKVKDITFVPVEPDNEELDKEAENLKHSLETENSRPQDNEEFVNTSDDQEIEDENGMEEDSE